MNPKRLFYTGALVGALLLVVLVLAFAHWDSWLATPISGNTNDHIAETLKWHGRLMVAAWGLLLPLAVIIARYFKITPRQAWPARLDNPFWFISHRRLGHIIVGIMTVALIIALIGRGLTIFSNFHSILGWLVILLAWAQLAGSYLRGTHGGPVNPFTRQPKPESEWPGDHFSLTRRRVIFEYAHKTVGYLLTIVAAVTIVSGLWTADALRWMWIGLGIWWALCLVAFVILQRRIRCIDTYQAIWGLDRSLPGYRREPIGVGITRFTTEDANDAPWQALQRAMAATPASPRPLTNESEQAHEH